MGSMADVMRKIDEGADAAAQTAVDSAVEAQAAADFAPSVEPAAPDSGLSPEALASIAEAAASVAGSAGQTVGDAATTTAGASAFVPAADSGFDDPLGTMPADSLDMPGATAATSPDSLDVPPDSLDMPADSLDLPSGSLDVPAEACVTPATATKPNPPGAAPAPDDAVAAWDPARVDAVVVAFHDRYSAICEQYRSVRARLVTMNTTRAHQVLAITSSIPEEGKSVTTVNLGLTMAEGGEHRILIADADFRRTSMARLLGVRGKPGLADVLRGDLPLHEALQSSPFPNLKVLPAGEMRDNAYGELLGGPHTPAVLEQMRKMFDYTFLDTPPVTTVSDVCLLSPYCNGALMVIEMRRTPEPSVQQAVRTLQANNVKLIGCILSRFRDGGASYYDHYYSAYYR